MRWQTARWMRPQKVGDVLPHFLAHGAPLHIIPAGKGAPSKRKPILHLHSMGTGCILWMKLICSRCVEQFCALQAGKVQSRFQQTLSIWSHIVWRACSRIRSSAILRACKAVPKDEENSACVQIGNTGRLAYRHQRCFKTSPHKHTAMGMAQRLKPRRRSAHICTQHTAGCLLGFIKLQRS